MEINIGQNIRTLREKKNLRQEELGSKIGVSGATISSWEIGRTEPNMGYTQLLANFFGVSMDKLIYGFDSFIEIPTDERPYSVQMASMNLKMPPEYRNDIQDYEERCKLYLKELYDVWNSALSDTNVEIKLPNAEPITRINTYGPICCGDGTFVDDNIIGMVSIPTSMLPKGKKEFFAQYAQGDSMNGAGIHDGDLLIFSKEQCGNGQIGCFCIGEEMATCKKLQMTGNAIILSPANDKYDPIVVDPEDFRCVGKMVLRISKV